MLIGDREEWVKLEEEEESEWACLLHVARAGREVIYVGSHIYVSFESK